MILFILLSQSLWAQLNSGSNPSGGVGLVSEARCGQLSERTQAITPQSQPLASAQQKPAASSARQAK